jgi:hypothetical protein
VCLKEVSEWKQIVHNGELYKPNPGEVLDKTKDTIVVNPWVSSGHYGRGMYSTWNPAFNDRRVFSGYCYECWSNYSDYIMIVDGNVYGGLHLVTNWTSETNITVQRTSGEIQEGNTFFTSLWNFKNVPEAEKTQEDKQRELEKIVYAYFNYVLGEFCLVVSLTKDGAHKAVPVSQLMKHNPHLPGFQFRFPNRVPFHKILQWESKNTKWAHKRVKHYGFMSEWYNPDL